MSAFCDLGFGIIIRTDNDCTWRNTDEELPEEFLENSDTFFARAGGVVPPKQWRPDCPEWDKYYKDKRKFYSTAPVKLVSAGHEHGDDFLMVRSTHTHLDWDNNAEPHTLRSFVRSVQVNTGPEAEAEYIELLKVWCAKLGFDWDKHVLPANPDGPSWLGVCGRD